jgi:protein-S-isoprenylcysteine O-methyltransferase Ste14
LPENFPMALIHSFEKSGNWLFKHRGEIPVVLFLFAIPVVYFTKPVWLGEQEKLVVSVVAVFLSALGFVVRAISIGTTPKGTSGRNTRQGQVAESLNNDGIYSTVRHPLYLGNYLMWIGIVMFTFSFSFVLVVSLAFWLYYERIMFAEEQFLMQKFGKQYEDWAAATPAFIPSFKSYSKNTMPFSLKSVLRREYSGFLATVFGFVYIDLLRFYFEYGRIEWHRTSVYVLLISLLITLILRSLKHYTQLLKESDRS